jgi:uncharacterized membrane protein
LLLFNIGCYNLCVSIAALVGLLIQDMDLCVATMIVFALNGLFRANSPAEGVVSSLVHMVPPIAVIGYYYSNKLDESTAAMDTLVDTRTGVTEMAIMIPAAMHASFFLIESVLFPRVELIRKLFIGGRAAASSAAVSVSSGLMFQQGAFNLNLAAVTFYGYYYLRSRHVVIAMLLVYVGAALALIYSAPPKQAVGGIAQGGPPLYALYLLLRWD